MERKIPFVEKEIQMYVQNHIKKHFNVQDQSFLTTLICATMTFQQLFIFL
jgi:hypothetical protein